MRVNMVQESSVLQTFVAESSEWKITSDAGPILIPLVCLRW